MLPCNGAIKKIATLMSIVHSASMQKFKDSKGREVTKPNAVRDYNPTMGGVDQSDQMLAKYLVTKNSRSITRRFFAP